MAVVLLKLVREAESHNREAGIVICASLVLSIGWGFKVFLIHQYVLTLGTMDVADACVPSRSLERFAQKTGVCPKISRQLSRSGISVKGAFLASRPTCSSP